MNEGKRAIDGTAVSAVDGLFGYVSVGGQLIGPVKIPTGPLVEQILADPALKNLIVAPTKIRSVPPADLAATGPITLSGEKNIDGTMTNNSRVLAAGQGNPAENGLWRTGTGSWTREPDMNQPAEFVLTEVWVKGGVAGSGNKGLTFRTDILTDTGFVVGTTPVNFIQKNDGSSFAGIVDYWFTGVSGNGTVYSVTGPIPRAQLEDGTTRLVWFVPNVDIAPDSLGRTYISVDGSSNRIIQSENNIMTALGMLKAGVPVQIRVTGGTYTIHKMPYRLPEAPSDGTIIDWSSRSMVQFDQAKVEAGRLGQQVPEDWDTIQLPTMASGGERPLYLGLQAASRNVAITRPNQEVDLEWMRPGTWTSLFVSNDNNNASLRLKVPATSQVWGAAAASNGFYTCPNGTMLRVERVRISPTKSVFQLTALSGAIAVDANQVEKAHSFCVLFTGQSLWQRWCEGFGPMAIQDALASYRDPVTGARLYNPSIRILNLALGSSSMFWANDNFPDKTGHWWDERTNSPGPALLAAVAKLAAYMAIKPADEPNPQLIFHNIGQNDADNIFDTGVTTISSFRDHTRKAFNYLRNPPAGTGYSLPGLVVSSTPIGNDENARYTHAQASMQRAAELALRKLDSGAPDPLFMVGPDFLDVYRAHDDPHMNVRGQAQVAPRMADTLLKSLGISSKGLGVSVVSHTQANSGKTHQVRLRSVDGRSLNRPALAEPPPYGIKFLPKVPPLPNLKPAGAYPEMFNEQLEAPYAITRWTISNPGVLEELIFEFDISPPDANACLVTNYGKGLVAEYGSRMISSNDFDSRPVLTYDERPWRRGKLVNPGIASVNGTSALGWTLQADLTFTPDAFTPPREYNITKAAGAATRTATPTIVNGESLVSGRTYEAVIEIIASSVTTAGEGVRLRGGTTQWFYPNPVNTVGIHKLPFVADAAHANVYLVFTAASAMTVRFADINELM